MCDDARTGHGRAIEREKEREKEKRRKRKRGRERVTTINDDDDGKPHRSQISDLGSNFSETISIGRVGKNYR